MTSVNQALVGETINSVANVTGTTLFLETPFALATWTEASLGTYVRSFVVPLLTKTFTNVNLSQSREASKEARKQASDWQTLKRVKFIQQIVLQCLGNRLGTSEQITDALNSCFSKHFKTHFTWTFEDHLNFCSKDDAKDCDNLFILKWAILGLLLRGTD